MICQLLAWWTGRWNRHEPAPFSSFVLLLRNRAVVRVVTDERKPRGATEPTRADGGYTRPPLVYRHMWFVPATFVLLPGRCAGAGAGPHRRRRHRRGRARREPRGSRAGARGAARDRGGRRGPTCTSRSRRGPLFLAGAPTVDGRRRGKQSRAGSSTTINSWSRPLPAPPPMWAWGAWWIAAGAGASGLWEQLGRHQLERLQAAAVPDATESAFTVGPYAFGEVGVAVVIRGAQCARCWRAARPSRARQVDGSGVVRVGGLAPHRSRI